MDMEQVAYSRASTNVTSLGSDIREARDNYPKRQLDQILRSSREYFPANIPTICRLR